MDGWMNMDKMYLYKEEKKTFLMKSERYFIYHR